MTREAPRARSPLWRRVRLISSLLLLGLGLAFGTVGISSDNLLRGARLDEPVALRVVDVLINESKRVIAIAPGERRQVYLSFPRQEAETLRLGDTIVAFPTGDEGEPYIAEAWVDSFWPLRKRGLGWSVASLFGALCLLLAGAVAFIRLPKSRAVSAFPPIHASEGEETESSLELRQNDVPPERRKSALFGFIGKHWRGEYTLARSYWIHGTLLSVVLALGIASFQATLKNRSLDTVLSVNLGLLSLIVVATIWQLVGIWRSASRSTRATGRRLWQRTAKVVVVIGALLALRNVGTSVFDTVGVFVASRSNIVAEYTIERLGSTDLILIGAINDDSASEIMYALADPAITILRVRSLGGLLSPAERLARFIEAHETMVLAEGECISACVMILAASPAAAIVPGTKVSFHRPETLVEYSNSVMQAEADRFLHESWEIYREFGVESWAIEIAKKQQFWTPTLRQLADMGLVEYVYDVDAGQFVHVREYCNSSALDCDS